MTIDTTILIGDQIHLEPFDQTHQQELYLAAQDENIWTFNSVKAYSDRFQGWFDKACHAYQNHQQIPYCVRRLSDNKIIGSTRFYDIHADHRRLTIGYTWYIPEVWGTYVNPACKLLLLKHAFETLQFNRVELVTDARNARSRAAIKKLGGIEEGILRQHMILEDGYVRDTVVYSIIHADWEKVRAQLLARLECLPS